MQDADVVWAQNVVDRWSTKKSVPAPRVTTIPTDEEVPLSGYRDSAIILNQKVWDKLDLAGKLLLLADPFSYHVRCASGTVTTDEEMSELARELIVLEVELWSDATGVRMTRLMKIEAISKLMSLLKARPAGR